MALKPSHTKHVASFRPTKHSPRSEATSSEPVSAMGLSKPMAVFLATIMMSVVSVEAQPPQPGDPPRVTFEALSLIHI